VAASVEIAVPPERVWDLVMDPDRLGDWVTIHRRLGKVSDRPLTDGSTIDQTLHLRGVSVKVAWTVSEARACRLAVWDGRGPAWAKAHTTYKLTPIDDHGTQFDYEVEFKAPLGPIGAAASRALVGGVPQREANKTLARLKALLEG
jgi:uncharacterized protein YndB with AHSA1/START domain